YKKNNTSKVCINETDLTLLLDISYVIQYEAYITDLDYHIAIEATLKELAGPMNPSVNLTALQFGISEATLRHAVKNGLSKCTRPKIILSEHKEEQLVDYCKNMQRLEFGLTKLDVNHCIMEIVCNNHHAHSFAAKGPDRTWWDCFMKDHSDLSFRTFQALSKAYTQKANPIIIKDCFKQLQKIIKKHSLTAEYG
ncbi:5396_t:CDS:2, partial [Cetraspora pellucida]